MKTETCPSPQTLQRLLLGTLPPSEREPLEEHLLSCDHCVANAETIAIDDDLTQLTRGVTVSSDNQSEAVMALIERVKAARKQAETMRLEETVDGSSPSRVPSSSSDDASSNLSFLAPAEAPDELGRLGEYRVLQVLGMGGMGVVLKAEDIRLKRVVALKTMKSSIATSRDAKSRFLREAQATAALEHDHIVPIYQVGEDRGVPFIAMQFLKGESLAKRLDRVKKLSASEIVRLGREVALALACAHEAGLIHRDIKPDNVWLDEKSDRAKVLDFGLVSATCEDDGLTQAGTVLGTPKYMAPEQALGYPADHRADLFSLGTVLYHAATGEAPFAGNNFTATLIAVANQQPKSLQTSAPDLPVDVANLIMQLLEKDPDKRPQAAGEVARRFADLERELKTVPFDQVAVNEVSDTVAQKSPFGSRSLVPPRKPPRRNLLVAGAGGLFALALGVIVITIREKDGTETVVRVPTGTEIDVQASPGSKVTIDGPKTSDHVTPATAVQPTVAAMAPPAVTVPKKLTVDRLREAHGDFVAPASGMAVSALSLVARPEKLEGVSSWTFETPTHRGVINACQVSPDGNVLATGGQDGTVRLWDVKTMKSLGMLCGHDWQVQSVDWSDDGSALLTAGGDELCVWDWKEARRLLHHRTGRAAQSRDTFLFAKWLPADNTIVYLSQEGIFFLDPESLATFKSIDDTATSWRPSAPWSFDKNRTRVALPTGEGAAVWNLESGELIQKFTVEQPWLCALSPGAETLAVACREGKLLVFDVGTGEQLGEPLTQNGANWASLLEFSTDGKSLAFARDRKSTVHFWNTSTWQETAKLTLPHPMCSSLTWSESAGVFITTGSGSDTGIALYHSETRRPMRQLATPIAKEIRFVDVHPKIAQLVASCAIEPSNYEASPVVVSLEDGIQRAAPPGRPSRFHVDVRWSRTGRYLYDRKLNLWDSDQKSLIESTQLTSTADYFFESANYVSWDVDDAYLSRQLRNDPWGDSTGNVCVTKLADLKSSAPLVDDHVYGVDFSPVSNELAVHHGPDPNSPFISIIDIPSGKILRAKDKKWPGSEAAGEIRWSPDGKYVAASYIWGIIISDAQSLETIAYLDYDQHGAGGRNFSWCGSNTIVCVVATGNLHIWNAPFRDKQSHATIFNRANRFSGIDASPAGQLVFSWDAKAGTVYAWDSQTQQLELCLIGVGTEDPGHSLAISADGSFKSLLDETTAPELIAVVQTSEGQQVLSLKEFSEMYGWTNHPERLATFANRTHDPISSSSNEDPSPDSAKQVD